MPLFLLYFRISYFLVISILNCLVFTVPVLILTNLGVKKEISTLFLKSTRWVWCDQLLLIFYF